MRWIVKATASDFEYVSHYAGEMFGSHLSDAFRFETQTRAANVAAKLNRTMKDGLPYRVVRLRPRHVRITLAAAKALRAAVVGDRFEAGDMNAGIAAIDEALQGRT